jgi:Pyridine nucleotide-disulphide oxidoreductase
LIKGPAQARARPETKDPRAGGRTACPAECDSRASAIVSVMPLPGSCAPSANVGGGYIGLEMADALTVRGLAVTQIEQLAEVLPTVDPQLGAQVHAELAAHGVEVLTGTTVHPRRTQEARAVAGQLDVAVLQCCTGIKNGQLQDRNWLLSWVGDTGIEPVTSSV